MAGFDPVSAGLAGVGAIGSIYGSIQQRKEEKRLRRTYEQEAARQSALRSRVAGELRPQIEADIQGIETPGAQLARERFESLQREQLGRSGEARRQALIDRLARMGGARGRTAADITAPAAQRGITQFETGERRGMRELAIRISQANALRREQARQAGMGRALQLGQFEAGGFVPPVQSTAGSEIGMVGSELLGQGLARYFARRDKDKKFDPTILTDSPVFQESVNK